VVIPDLYRRGETTVEIIAGKGERGKCRARRQSPEQKMLAKKYVESWGVRDEVDETRIAGAGEAGGGGKKDHKDGKKK